MKAPVATSSERCCRSGRLSPRRRPEAIPGRPGPEIAKQGQHAPTDGGTRGLHSFGPSCQRLGRRPAASTAGCMACGADAPTACGGDVRRCDPRRTRFALVLSPLHARPLRPCALPLPPPWRRRIRPRSCGRPLPPHPTPRATCPSSSTTPWRRCSRPAALAGGGCCRLWVRAGVGAPTPAPVVGTRHSRPWRRASACRAASRWRGCKRRRA